MVADSTIVIYNISPLPMVKCQHIDGGRIDLGFSDKAEGSLSRSTLLFDLRFGE